MKIEAFCRNKKAGWTGVIFREDNGRTRITNGVAIWDDSEKRRAGLDLVERIDLQEVCDGLERYHLNDQLLAALQSFPQDTVLADQEYLARPLLEGVTYEITEERIRIKNDHTVLAEAKGPDSLLDQKKLLEQYRNIYQMAKKRGVKVSFSEHYRWKLQRKWKEYESDAEARQESYRRLLEQARVLQNRGIHMRYADDGELNRWRELYRQYTKHNDALAPCAGMERLAQELAGLERELSNLSDNGRTVRVIYL